MNVESVRLHLADILRQMGETSVPATNWADGKTLAQIESLGESNKKLTDTILSALVSGEESEVESLLAGANQNERDHLEGILLYLGERISVSINGKNEMLVHFLIPCVFYATIPLPNQPIVLAAHLGEMLSRALEFSGLLKPEDFFRLHLLPIPFSVHQSLSPVRQSNLGRDMLMGKINESFLIGEDKNTPGVPKLLLLHGFVNNNSMSMVLSPQDTAQLAENISQALNPFSPGDIGFRLIAGRPYPYSSAMLAAPVEFIQLMVSMGERLGVKNMTLRANGLFSESPESVMTEVEFMGFPFALPPLRFRMNPQDRRFVRETLENRLKSREVTWLRPS